MKLVSIISGFFVLLSFSLTAATPIPEKDLSEPATFYGSAVRFNTHPLSQNIPTGFDLIGGMHFRDGFFSSDYETRLTVDALAFGPSVRMMKNFHPIRDQGFFIGSGVGIGLIYLPQQQRLTPQLYSPFAAGYTFKSGQKISAEYDHQHQTATISFGYRF